MFDFLDERIHVTAFPAAEAVEVAVVRTHVERRCLLVVKWAETLQRIGAGAPQLDIVPDNILDTGPFTDGGNIAIGDAAGHRLSVESMGPGCSTGHAAARERVSQSRSVGSSAA